MENHYLTKSDFKVAQTCATKLYYRKMKYPTVEEGDDYLDMIAHQGYLLEALARALYPEGRWVGSGYDLEGAAWETMAALAEDHCTLFEATFIIRGKLARIDILVKRGNTLELIEIKSRGFNQREHESLLAGGQRGLFYQKRHNDQITAEWRPYLEDAAFQYSILDELFAGVTIVPYLMMPDTSRSCDSDGLHRQIVVQPVVDEKSTPLAVFSGDPRELRRNLFLTKVNVLPEVRQLLASVREASEHHRATLTPRLTRPQTPLSLDCRRCEYRVTGSEPNGFRDCWGELADVNPHILDLYNVGRLSGKSGRLADELIAAGKAGMYDIPGDSLRRRDGKESSVTDRMRIQITCTREGREWVSDELSSILDGLVYPLYFIDFETATPVIPRYRGMRPFQPLAFQWSCHTLDAPEAAPVHSEWLQAADQYPNKDFAKALRRQVGDAGTVLAWSKHEATILRAVSTQLTERETGLDGLVNWLTTTANRLIDMNELTLRHYFHPLMRGSTSLKVVADAMWQASPRIREQFSDRHDSSGLYASLPPVIVRGREVSVADGRGAILAYYEMMDSEAAGSLLEAERWRSLLLRYCELDTLAMVMVWRHWRALSGR